MAAKKPSEYDEKPNHTMGLVGIGMIVLAAVWFTWSAFLRPETPVEKKERETMEQEKKRDEARKSKYKKGAPPPSHGH